MLRFLDQNVRRLKESSVLVITSKIAAILEGAVLPMAGVDKKQLITREADLWLPPLPRSKFNITLTVKNGALAATAGIDESNSGGWYVLWPRDPQRSANVARRHLMKKFRLRELGVILTDSTSAPLRRGINGVAIAHSGFLALNNYIGKEDLFGRKLKMTKTNMMQGLATAAVLLMGEGAERVPLAVIEDLPFVQFRKADPSRAELAELRVGLREDMYAPILNSVKWKKGRGGR